MKFSFSIAITLIFIASSGNAEEFSIEFRNFFRAICFDTNWIQEGESSDLGLFGFEPKPIEGPRRGYSMDNLMLATFLTDENVEEDGPVCTLMTKTASPDKVRDAMTNWPEASRPYDDQIIDGKRFTTWSVSYRRNSGVVLMEEETIIGETIVRLSLIGDR